MEIRNNIVAAMAGRTLIVITHRLTSIADIDNVVHIADGAIVAQNSTDSLVPGTAAMKGKLRNIELEATEDILKTVAGLRPEKKRPQAVVGFAAESRDLLENAAAKLKSKGLDFIAANDISAEDAGFAVETNRVTLLYADGDSEPLSLMSKTEVAETISGRLAALLA